MMRRKAEFYEKVLERVKIGEGLLNPLFFSSAHLSPLHPNPTDHQKSQL